MEAKRESDMTRKIYADNAGTTPVSQKVMDAMLPYFMDEFGNASAVYDLGVHAKAAREDARRKIAAALGARDNEIYFTSGGTESDNWALCGSVELRKNQGNHVVITAIEHSAVLHTAEKLEAQGYDVEYLAPDEFGQITPDQLSGALRSDTILVSIMLANNEVGTILPIKELCSAVKACNRKIIFHTDAVQAVGHISLNVRDLGVDLLSLSAHKFNGPKGVGALFMKLGTSIPPFMLGGGHEKGKRSGTDNIPGIVGMATALEESVARLEETQPHIEKLRDRLIERTLQIKGAHLTGDPLRRLPGSASFVFDELVHAPIIKRLSDYGICASAGSACSAGSGDPSRVLLALGYPAELAKASVRFSLSERNTLEEMDYIADALSVIVAELRNAEPVIASMSFSNKPD